MERKDIIQELQLKYAEEKIIPFVGAGMSIPFEMPEWSQLIEELKKLVPKELYPAIDNDLNNGRYQEAVDDIKKFASCGEQVIQEKIADLYNIGYIKPEDRPDSNYVDLVKSGFSIYLTTNYDKLLEWHLPDANSFASLLEYDSNTQRIFSRVDKNIFHLHGATRKPNSIVISTESYENLYKNPRYDDLIKIFSSTHSYLFLGFSFNDVFFKNLLAKHKNIFKGSHYLVISKNSIEKRLIQELNENFGIKVIEYDVSESSHLTEIRKILDEITQEPTLNIENKKVQEGVQFKDLQATESHESSLFYKKLEVAKINTDLKDLSVLFYISAEKFIRESVRLGYSKDYIDEILAEIFLRYKDRYTVLYSLQKKDSNELLLAIHEDLREINIERYKKMANFDPTASETQGMIHVLADDASKNIWWGSERID